MIKHSSGMVSCLKYVTNKVSSFIPLVLRRSHVFVCSRQLTHSSSTSSLPLEYDDIYTNFPSRAAPDHQAFVDSQINHAKTLQFQCSSKFNRYLSFLIFVSEDHCLDQSYLPTASYLCCPYYHNANVLCSGIQDDVDRFCAGEVSHPFRGKGRFGGMPLYFSSSELLKSGPESRKDPGQEGIKSAADSFEPPSEEQLENIARTLANTLPSFFVKPLDIRIYHRNIVLEDNIRGKRFSGIEQYFMQSRLLYIVGHLRFMYINLDVMKITSHPEDGTVKVRWKISVFRLSRIWRLKLFNISSSFQDAKDTWIDGFSTYFVMGDGMVHKHIVDKMIPDPDQMIKKSEPAKSVPVPNPLAYSDRNKV